MEFDRLLLKCARPFTNKWSRYGIIILYALFVIVHNISIAGLEKPAGLKEAFEFMWQQPSNFAPALLCGLIAYPLPFFLLVTLVATFLADKMELRDYNDYYDDIEDIKPWEYIVALLVLVAAFICNAIFINYILLLGIALGIVIFFLYCIVSSN